MHIYMHCTRCQTKNQRFKKMQKVVKEQVHTDTELVVSMHDGNNTEANVSPVDVATRKTGQWRSQEFATGGA